MPLTNPWLVGPTPDRDLPPEQLEERILNLLSTHNLAVIATVSKDGSPVATPVRFYSLGFEIFYTSWNTSMKSRNLRRDPRVSAGIVAPLVGQASSRGAQLFGTARTLERDDLDADHYWEAFRWQSDHVERGRSVDDPQPIHSPSSPRPGSCTPTIGYAAAVTDHDRLGVQRERSARRKRQGSWAGSRSASHPPETLLGHGSSWGMHLHHDAPNTTVSATSPPDSVLPRKPA